MSVGRTLSLIMGSTHLLGTRSLSAMHLGEAPLPRGYMGLRFAIGGRVDNPPRMPRIVLAVLLLSLAAPAGAQARLCSPQATADAALQQVVAARRGYGFNA